MQLFRPGFTFTAEMSEALERDGHLLLPGVCPPAAVGALTAACQRCQEQAQDFTVTKPAAVAALAEMARPDASPDEKKRATDAFQRLFHEQGADAGFHGPLPAETDAVIGDVVSCRELLELMRGALGSGGRDASKMFYSACSLLNRLPDTDWAEDGMGTHSHAYAEGFARNNVDRIATRADKPQEAMIRVFFYVNGFSRRYGGCLTVIPGSHKCRDPGLGATLQRWREEGKTKHSGVANCNLNAILFLNFRLKMQR